MSNITHTMRGNNCIADNCNETREWAEQHGHNIVEADEAQFDSAGKVLEVGQIVQRGKGKARYEVSALRQGRGKDRVVILQRGSIENPDSPYGLTNYLVDPHKITVV